jgi:3',5'-nucleoside bisphosphate phosphatase
VYHPANSEEVRTELLATAKEKGLLCTGGTDYHGLFMKNPIPLGSEEMPDAVYRAMEEYLEIP